MRRRMVDDPDAKELRATGSAPPDRRAIDETSVDRRAPRAEAKRASQRTPWEHPDRSRLIQARSSFHVFPGRCIEQLAGLSLYV